MYRIKRFNEDNENMYSYYTEITAQDYFKNANKKDQENFKSGEISILRDLKCQFNLATLMGMCVIMNPISEKEYLIDIFKKSDEWFYVRVNELKNNRSFHYKCDQINGVVKLLKKYREDDV
jgi:hypothetical protein